jgi:hypothetical protein
VLEARGFRPNSFSYAEYESLLGADALICTNGILNMRRVRTPILQENLGFFYLKVPKEVFQELYPLSANLCASPPYSILRFKMIGYSIICDRHYTDD